MEVNLEGMEFRLTAGEYQISGGFDAKCLLDETENPDWARLSLTDELFRFLKGIPIDQCTLEMGNASGYESLLSGHGELTEEHTLLVQTEVRQDCDGISVFILEATLQEAARYIFSVFGINRYVLTDREFGRRQNYRIDAVSYKEALRQINAVYGADLDHYTQDGILYYGVYAEQDQIYVLSDDHVLDMEQMGLGTIWRAEIIPVPGLRVREVVQMTCEEFTGMAVIRKCIIEGNASVMDMWIEFKEIHHG